MKAVRDPLKQFRHWLHWARRQCPEAELDFRVNAMSLATVSVRGNPSCRTVLFRGVSSRGLLFFTNYRSRKGQDLASNPRAALTFLWAFPNSKVSGVRQIRLEGRVVALAEEVSDHYFSMRPRGHQLGAWASPQSQIISSRQILLQERREALRRFGSGIVPRPKHWGGFEFIPESIEFWVLKKDRLHDRRRYRRTAKGWASAVLAP